MYSTKTKINTGLGINVAADAASEFRGFSKARPIAQKIGLCPKTIRRWSNKGYIKRFKLSDRISLYDEKEIYDYIQAAKLNGNGGVL
jgi:hypothetical protein